MTYDDQNPRENLSGPILEQIRTLIQGVRTHQTAHARELAAVLRSLTTLARADRSTFDHELRSLAFELVLSESDLEELLAAFQMFPANDDGQQAFCRILMCFGHDALTTTMSLANSALLLSDDPDLDSLVSELDRLARFALGEATEGERGDDL